MKPMRLARHLFTTRAAVRRRFPPSCIAAITQAIAQSESTHRGEIRFAIEASLSPQQVLRDMGARERALEIFAALRVWDTEDNSGVLIYVLPADHAIEIVADRGINLRAADGTWAGIAAVSRELSRHLPATDGNPNELSDDVTLL